jgi:hypothetical protein
MGQIKTTLTILILVLTLGQSVGQNTRIKLSDKFNGNWVNTSLFDSTTIKRKLSPWINEFYGNAILEFTKDTVLLWGCIDGGPIEKMKILSTTSFSTDEMSFKAKFQYIENLDLIKMTASNNFLTVIFRRVKSTDRLDIVTDKKKFENYFKALFFDNFFKADKNFKVDKLWTGFETYKPFGFDAFGVRTKNGDINYFGWEQIGNTLRIFQTTKNTDKDSGFYYWTKGKLDREIELK